MKFLNIALIEPEIPQNTGNISRTCACTGIALHLVKPMGFEINDKQLKRAGLDYWNMLDVTIYESLEEFNEKTKDFPHYYVTTKGKSNYDKVCYEENCFIVFGKETKGLPEKLLYENYDRCIRIPMVKSARSLNLSNSVAIVAYEALRQNDFADLLLEGHLTEY
ncbi:MAG: tRNA (uridine(34)/cytosine(34)/5-carboxymethylaminomethyluridine(34)-2'-O)-methyltransferase TrmL [Clostridia bacterium]